MSLLLLLVPLLLAIAAMIGTVATVVRWGFRLGVALVAALVARLILPAPAGGGWVPLVVFLAVLALLAMRGRRTRRPVRAGARTIDNVAAASGAGPGPAWPALRTMADWRTRRRLDAASDACARYLLLAEGHEDPSAQLPIKIRKHLPSIVSDCVRHCRTATRDEQRALIAETLETVETIAARADVRRRELSHAAQGDFRTLKTHLTRED